MPHSERQMQIGTSTIRAMMQDMKAGRIKSVGKSQRR